jgi:16S rRNA (uracil1498-N3)-methyltransferase
MTTPRFLVREGLAPGASIVLPEAVSHHARRVLRLRADDPIVLFDGAGNEFAARLHAGAPDAALLRATITTGGPVDREARIPITLVQALCVQDKVDWLVEKCVELGASRVFLAPSERSVVRLDAGRRDRRAARLRDIAVAACCQSGRNRIPAITLFEDLAAALEAARTGATARWILDPAAASGLHASAGAPVCCAVGPEGGFTAAELALASSMGYRAARLGARVLRTETAGLAAITTLLALEGEFS